MNQEIARSSAPIAAASVSNRNPTTSSISTTQAASLSSSSAASASASAAANKIKVYTKTGDKGTSQLYNGERRPKDDAVFEALGAVDELNASVGVAKEFLLVEKVTDPEFNLVGELEEVLSRLLDVGAAVATPLDTTKSQAKINRVSFSADNTTRLEKNIDKMDEQLPPLKNFILPVSSFLCIDIYVYIFIFLH